MDDSSKRPPGVVVVQPGQLLGEALACAVEVHGCRVAAVHGRLDALLRSLPHHLDEVLVVDRDSFRDEGDDTSLADLRALAPDARIIVLAEELDAASVRAARDGAIDGLVLKDASAADLVAAIRLVGAGQGVFPAGYSGAARRLRDAEESEPPLSPRQQEVLELLAEGLTNEEIGRRLCLSANTVKFHLREIYDRLGVHNRIQAAEACRHLN